MATATDTAALLAERDAVVQELEAVRAEGVTEVLAVVDAEGNDTGFRVRRVPPSERQRKIRRLTAELDYLERELRNRGYE